MSISIQEQILNELEKRLRCFTTGNGYSLTFENYKREQLRPLQANELPILNFWGGSDRRDTQYTAGQRRIFQLSISAFAASNDRPGVDLAFELGAQLKTVISRSASAPRPENVVSPDLGGLVSELSFDELLPVIGEGQTPYYGIMVDLSAYYFADRHDAYLIDNP